GRKSIVTSPDGARLAYIASVSGGTQRIYTRSLNQPKAVELAGTDGARVVFFSPDSRWIGFITNDKLYKVSVESGGTVFLAEARDEAGADWGVDGSIVMGGLALQRGQGRLRHVPEAGGEPTKILDMADGEIAHGDPHILPGGKAALFSVSLNNASPDRTSI